MKNSARPMEPKSGWISLFHMASQEPALEKESPEADHGSESEQQTGKAVADVLLCPAAPIHAAPQQVVGNEVSFVLPCFECKDEVREESASTRNFGEAVAADNGGLALSSATQLIGVNNQAETLDADPPASPCVRRGSVAVLAATPALIASLEDQRSPGLDVTAPLERAAWAGSDGMSNAGAFPVPEPQGYEHKPEEPAQEVYPAASAGLERAHTLGMGEGRVDSPCFAAEDQQAVRPASKPSPSFSAQPMRNEEPQPGTAAVRCAPALAAEPGKTGQQITAAIEHAEQATATGTSDAPHVDTDCVAREREGLPAASQSERFTTGGLRADREELIDRMAEPSFGGLATAPQTAISQHASVAGVEFITPVADSASSGEIRRGEKSDSAVHPAPDGLELRMPSLDSHIESQENNDSAGDLTFAARLTARGRGEGTYAPFRSEPLTGGKAPAATSETPLSGRTSEPGEIKLEHADPGREDGESQPALARGIACQAEVLEPSNGIPSESHLNMAVSEAAKPLDRHTTEVKPRDPAAAHPETRPLDQGEVQKAGREPLRDITLRLQNDDGRVEVRLRERSGEIRVAVRTPDEMLARELRRGLPSLAASLEETGFRSDEWRSGRSSRIHPDSESVMDANQQARDEARSGRRGHEESAREPNQERKTPIRKRSTEFAWFMNSIA